MRLRQTIGTVAILASLLSTFQAATAHDGEGDVLTPLYEDVVSLVWCSLWAVDVILQSLDDWLPGEGYPGQTTVHALMHQFSENGTVYRTLYDILHPLGHEFVAVLALVNQTAAQLREDADEGGEYLARHERAFLDWAQDAKCLVAETLVMVHKCMDPIQVHPDGHIEPEGAFCTDANQWAAMATDRWSALENLVHDMPQLENPCWVASDILRRHVPSMPPPCVMSLPDPNEPEESADAQVI